MRTVIFIITTVIATVQWWIERVKFTAIVYYIVEKGYTEPTKEEMERCIDVASKEAVEKWFRK